MFSVLVKDGLVVNRTEGGIPAEWSDEDRAGWIEDDMAQIGWSYDGKGFTAPPRPPDPEPEPVPVDPLRVELDAITARLIAVEAKTESLP